ncbi:MAG: hypothetical protein KJ949_01055 [Nanoarchaeota archaeon]|nr:hypothetical protein [Nanoarchaeota archaeon]
MAEITVGPKGKEEKFNLVVDHVNFTIAIESIFRMLIKKGLIKKEEFDKIREEIFEEFKKEHPGYFK